MNAVAEPLMFAVPRCTAAAVIEAARRGFDALRAQAPIRLADWAREHFVLVGDSSHETGRWNLWPFQEALLDWMADDAIEELDVRKSRRVGYTKSLAAFIAYNAAHRHRKQALYQPTDDDRDSFVSTEVEPILNDVRVLRQARRATRGGRERVSLKRFRSSVAHFLGGKAARAYRRITVAVVMLDELDGFDRDIEKSGDAASLARGRLQGAPFPKLVCGSTPLVKNSSNIEDREKMAEVAMRYHIECRHCGLEHPLLFDLKRKSRHGLQWDAGSPASVRHVCPHCLGSISLADFRANQVGAWVCVRTGIRYGADRMWRDATGAPMRAPRHVSAQVWAAYSPQVTWEEIAREFDAAAKLKKAGDSGAMKVYVNETLGELWEEDFEQTDRNALRSRADAALRLRMVPRHAYIVFAGVDVQDDRLVYVAAAFGRHEECWIIDDRVLYGDPGKWALWAELDKQLDVRYPHAGGQTCAIDAVAIDTGGHYTHMVYRYAMLRAARRVYATKGHTQAEKPIVAGAPSRVDVNADGQLIKDGTKLWFIGTGTAKDLLHNRLQLGQPGAGYVHFPAGLPPEFYDEITAEVRMPQRTARGTVTRWVKPTSGTRNERLDCMVGILFCAARFNLQHYTDAEWRRLELALCPPTADLFVPPVVEPLPEPVPTPADPTAPADAAVQPAADEPADLAAAPPVWAGQRRRRVLSRGVA